MAENSFLKNIELNFKPSKKSLDDIEDTLSKLGSKLKLSEDQKKAITNLKSLKNEIAELESIISDLGNTDDKLVKDIKNELDKKVKEYNKLLGKDEQKEKVKEITTEIKGLLVDDLIKLGTKFVGDLRQIFKDAWKELDNTLQYSLLSNEQTRNLAFGYGFSASQAYGFSKALSVTGINNEENLMYANAEQLKLFKEAFEKYSDKYEKIYDSGLFNKMYEYQVEMEEFKEDMKLEVVEFFVDNKDTIKDGMMALMDISKVVLDIFSFMFGTYNSRVSAASDVISSYSSVTNNVSVSNTFNGIDAGNQQNLARLGAMTTEQLMASIGG